jgi:hypothetical protein
VLALLASASVDFLLLMSLCCTARSSASSTSGPFGAVVPVREGTRGASSSSATSSPSASLQMRDIMRASHPPPRAAAAAAADPGPVSDASSLGGCAPASASA